MQNNPKTRRESYWENDWTRSIFYVILVWLLVACTPVIQPPTQATMPATAASATAVAPAELTYNSGAGGFSLRYPATVTQMSDVRPTVDGVLTPAANTVAFVSEAPSYVLSITWFDLADRTVLRRFVNADRECPVSTATTGQPVDLAGYAALLFPDTPCGPFGATYLFAVVDLRGYRITVESMATYAEVQAAVETLLATLEFQPPQLGAALPAVAAEEPIVESIEVLVLESDPVQVEAVVRGQLPDACSFIERTEVLRAGNTFRIRMTAARQPNQRCAPMLTPFEQVVPLVVPNPATGTYTVQIGEMVEEFTLGDGSN